MNDWLYEFPRDFNITKADLDEFLIWAYNKGADDIFLSSEEQLGVKFNDSYRKVTKNIITSIDLERFVNAINKPTAVNEIRSGEDQDFLYQCADINDNIYRFRVNMLASTSNQGDNSCIVVTMRTITEKIPTVAGLGLEKEIVESAYYSTGLYVVSGPTGSGKSTTLAAVIGDKLMNSSEVIISYESPVEFNLKNIPADKRKGSIQQTDVQKSLNGGFPRGARNSLRRAPDTIVYGELRDKETISSALLSAESGHMVMGTTHANSVASTLSRFTKAFPIESKAEVVLEAIQHFRFCMHQRLLEKRGDPSKRVALKEWLVFTPEVILELEAIAVVKSDITSDIERMVNLHGRPLLKSAEDKFRAGDISFADFAKIVKEKTSDFSFYRIIPEVADDLLQKGIIAEEEHAASHKYFDTLTRTLEKESKSVPDVIVCGEDSVNWKMVSESILSGDVGVEIKESLISLLAQAQNSSSLQSIKG